MAEHHTPAQSGEPEIHLPSPTLAPPIVGLGVTILTFGVLGLAPGTKDAANPVAPLAIPLLIVGGLLMVAGIALWLINDAREFLKAGDHGGHGGH